MRNATRGTAREGRALAAGLLALLGACGGGDRPGGGTPEDSARAAEGTPVSGGTAVFAELSDVGILNPLISATALDADMSDVMFMNILRPYWTGSRMEYKTADESPMALARRWELLGADSASLRYHLRTDAKWSDGRPITAQDVVFTYALLADTLTGSPRHAWTEHMDSVRADNDSTVTFHFDRRYPAMLYHTSLPPVPKHVLEGANPADLRTHPSVQDPAGHGVFSGSFRVASRRPGDRVELVPNPHFRPAPRLERIVIRVIPEVTTRLAELLGGRIDYTRPIPFHEMARIQAAPHLRLEREEKRFYDFVAYNPRFAPFADRRVREALGMALDVPGLIERLRMGEFAIQAGGPYLPLMKELYDPAANAPLPYDTVRAKQLLAEAGWRDTDRDGILDKDGRPFRFNLLINSGNQRRLDASQILQAQWRRVGVDAQIQPLETGTFFDRQIKKDYEAALTGWGAGLDPALDELWSKDAGLNTVSYDDPATEALFARATAATTEEAAAPIWREAAARISAARPYTWLFYFDQVGGANRRLRGMDVDTYGAYQNAWEWWIPKEYQDGPSTRAR